MRSCTSSTYAVPARVFYGAQKVVDAVEADVIPKCNIDSSGCKQCDLIGD
jgi:hypothetical protein